MSASWNSLARRRSSIAMLLAAAAGLAASAAIPGCASVSVRRVKDDEVKGPNGVRFYRPRPYVVVHEPFVIGSKAYLVGGQVTPDGKYININNVADDLAGHFKADLGYARSTRIEMSRVDVLGTASRPGDAIRGGAQGDTPPAPPSEPPPKPEPKPEPGGSQPSPTGQLDLKVVNHNDAFAVQPLRRYIDLVYLPDFDEDYVVEVKERFGSASADMHLGQGWSLQGMEAKIDNSAVTGPILELMRDSLKLLSQLSKAAAGRLEGVIAGAAQGEGETPDATTRLVGGTNVTVKVTVVRLAAPGLYPILKPKELEAFNAAAAAAIDPEYRSRVLVPIPPLTNIAFNTYEVIVVEAAPADGDSALRMQQYVDAAGSRAIPPGGEGGDALTGQTVTVIQTRLNTALHHSNGPRWTAVLTPNPQMTQITVALTSTGGGTPPESKDAVKAMVRSELDKRNLSHIQVILAP